jgi:signal peptidase II
MSDLVATFHLPKNKLGVLVVALVTAALTLAADQWTKAQFFSSYLFTVNTGVSLRFGESLPNFLVIGLLMIVLLAVSWLLRQIWHKNPVALGLLWGGALGNLVDRIWWGGVRDWWTVPLWGVKNNLADWAIFGAVVMIAAQLFFERKNHEAGSSN